MKMVECKMKARLWCVQVVDKNSHIGLKEIPEKNQLRFERYIVNPGDWIVTDGDNHDVCSDITFHNTYILCD